MSKSNSPAVTLSPDQLNDLDRALLDLLVEGRLTPTLARKQLDERGLADVSRQYINRRLKRLAEHEHIGNLLGTGVYELVEDPREDGGRDDVR
ncbi:MULTISPECIES: hypothetical protein [Halorussus]|uniref:hypothetical protein n=1 Tax=Halorussus TaxID=1070314 RepID=UPI00209E0D12|nr:hypothetical protein [Halorussus vallis]USZ75678.1 hypothetical protein NGM07_19895 [Halorussus vallis]USZ75753.1 hypothetical protein NGM07_00130 [Halorussus vallis]